MGTTDTPGLGTCWLPGWHRGGGKPTAWKGQEVAFKAHSKHEGLPASPQVTGSSFSEPLGSTALAPAQHKRSLLPPFPEPQSTGDRGGQQAGRCYWCCCQPSRALVGRARQDRAGASAVRRVSSVLLPITHHTLWARPHPPCFKGRKWAAKDACRGPSLPPPVSWPCLPGSRLPRALGPLLSGQPWEEGSPPFPWPAAQVSSAPQLEGTVGNRREH